MLNWKEYEIKTGLFKATFHYLPQEKRTLQKSFQASESQDQEW